MDEESLKILRLSGLKLENSNKQLITSCRNFSLEIIFVRHSDILTYLELGAIDLGIVSEVADLIFHTLILLVNKEIKTSDILKELEKRRLLKK